MGEVSVHVVCWGEVRREDIFEGGGGRPLSEGQMWVKILTSLLVREVLREDVYEEGVQVRESGRGVCFGDEVDGLGLALGEGADGREPEPEGWK